MYCVVLVVSSFLGFSCLLMFCIGVFTFEGAVTFPRLYGLVLVAKTFTPRWVRELWLSGVCSGAGSGNVWGHWFQGRTVALILGWFPQVCRARFIAAHSSNSSSGSGTVVTLTPQGWSDMDSWQLWDQHWQRLGGSSPVKAVDICDNRKYFWRP